MTISFLGRSLLLGALALFIISQPANAAADNNYDGLKAEMKAKRDSCGAVTPPTAETGHCLRACGAGLGFVRSGTDPKVMEQVVTSCRTAHKNAGAETPPKATETKNNHLELAKDAREKAFACSRSRPRTQEKIECRSKCIDAAYNLEQQKDEISNAVMNDLENCNAAHTAAGLDQDESSKPKQTEAEKINAMPTNANFCKAKMAGMTCGYGDFSSRDTLCSSLRACEVKCVHANVAENLASKSRNIRVEARKAMNRCIESRNRVDELLGK